MISQDDEEAMRQQAEVEFAEIESAVLEGLDEIERGEARPARTVFAELRAKHMG